MHKKHSMDLTEGSMLPLIIKFALPILVGQIFQNLYNSVDAMVVGHFVSTEALAAVSSSSDISTLLVGFFTGLSAGAGVLFSRAFGGKDYKKLHDCIHTALAFAIVVGVAMAVTGVIISPLLLKIVSCPDDVWPEAIKYLRVYLTGIIFTSVYNIGAGVLRAVGDTKDPFRYLLISGITNIVLDLLFVVVFDWGVMGVAAATIIAQLISMVLVLHNMLTTADVYKVEPKALRMDKAILREILDLGLPAGIQTSITAISNLFFQGYVNAFGSSAMAGFGAAKKIDRFVSMSSMSIGLTATTFVSQNLGADREKRAFRGIGVCFVLSAAVTCTMAALSYFFAESVSMAFTTDSAALKYSVMMIHCMMPYYICQVAMQVFSQATRGFGHSRAVMVLSVAGMVGMRQLYLFVITHLTEGVDYIFFGYPIGWIFAALFTLIFFLRRIYIPYRRKPRS